MGSACLVLPFLEARDHVAAAHPWTLRSMMIVVRKSYVPFAIVMLAATSCFLRPKPPTHRDPKRKAAEFDRIAVASFLGNQRGDPAYFKDGICVKAMDHEQKAFCEGDWKALKTPDIIAFAKALTLAACDPIADADLKAFCRSSMLTTKRSHWCEGIKREVMRSTCLAMIDGLPWPDDSPTTAEQPAGKKCIPNGGESETANGQDCCSENNRIVESEGGRVARHVCCEFGSSGCP